MAGRSQSEDVIMWPVERRINGGSWSRIIGRFRTMDEAADLIAKKPGVRDGDLIEVRWLQRDTDEIPQTFSVEVKAVTRKTISVTNISEGAQDDAETGEGAEPPGERDVGR